MLLNISKLWRKKEATADRCAACSLATCQRGAVAAILKMECGNDEACRLRNLGLYEGSCVTVVDRQDGYLLDVRGSRLAVGSAVASSITVLPFQR